MATDYGVDFSTFNDEGDGPDLDPYFTETTGPIVVVWSVVRSWLDPDTVDFRAHISSKNDRASLFALAQLMVDVAEQDDRVARVDLKIELVAKPPALRATGVVHTADGPFPFVLEVDKVTARLLEAPTS